MILRDRDANTDFDAEADGTLEERTYYLQNWRADVIALVEADGSPIQLVRYDAYGVPFGIPKSDMFGDGSVDTNDYFEFASLYGASNVRADWDFDGDFDGDDNTAYSADNAADDDLGRGAPSYAYAKTGGANRKLYAGYEYDPELAGETYHVRHRVLLAELGRWSRRDPAGYSDGWSLYAYAATMPDRSSLASGAVQDPELLWNCIAGTRGFGECLNCCGTDPECIIGCFLWRPPMTDPRDRPNDPPWNPQSPRSNPTKIYDPGNCLRYGLCRPTQNPVLCNASPRDPYHSLIPPGWNEECDCDILRDALDSMPGVEPWEPGVLSRPCSEYGTNCYKIAYMLSSPFPEMGICDRGYGCDFHIFREERDGRWTDKPGCSPVLGPYDDPYLEFKRRQNGDPDNGYYRGGTFCGYMCVCEVEF